jgi:aryl-alcohol dehydrogenase-like predicted oxidoreductase
MTRNHSHGFGVRDLVEISRIVSDAKSLGYSGVNFYESANLYELTDADTFMARAMAEHCLREAVRLATN